MWDFMKQRGTMLWLKYYMKVQKHCKFLACVCRKGIGDIKYRYH
jgi:hypothetical protein